MKTRSIKNAARRRSEDNEIGQLNFASFNVFYVERALAPFPHFHMDIEVTLVLEGDLECWLGGETQTFETGELVAFWAGLPHRMTAFSADMRAVITQIPLAWWHSWGVGSAFTQRLFRGEFVRERYDAGVAPVAQQQLCDRLLFEQWVEDCRHADADSQRTLSLELEARLRRMARRVTGTTEKIVLGRAREGEHLANLAEFISLHYREPLNIARIAQSVDLHPNYAMQVFLKASGISLWEYVTIMRVAHARRLLLTTDLKMHQIALEAGFSSMTPFRDAFKRIYGEVPSRDRKRRDDLMAPLRDHRFRRNDNTTPVRPAA